MQTGKKNSFFIRGSYTYVSGYIGMSIGIDKKKKKIKGIKREIVTFISQ